MNSFKHNQELMKMVMSGVASTKEIEEEDMRNCWRHERKILSES